jgi:hypothetical protein
MALNYESREPETYESGFLFSQETRDSRFRGNDQNGTDELFMNYEAINDSMLKENNLPV